MGVAALICAFMCAFFLKEPKGSFAAAYEGESPEVAPHNTGILAEK
jgi:NNP family nitrate/nitrite transporter-like MFS transporter